MLTFWDKNLKIRDLDCLVLWPKGAVGETSEMKLIEALVALMEVHGFGRVPQLASEIEEIWRDSSKIKKFKELKEKRMKEVFSQ